jgi:hypothetical protein
MTRAAKHSSVENDLLQPSSWHIPDRYELKYLISAAQAQAVRHAIEPYCTLDPHCLGRPGAEYAVQSLYLDTPGRDLYLLARDRHATRWKARVRRYGDSEGVFAEIKTKHSDIVSKQRVGVPLAGWAELLRRPAGVDGNAEASSFCRKIERYHLVPTLMVRYEREAWSSTVDSYARVTFDRRVVCQPWSDWSLEADDRAWTPLDGNASMKGIGDGVVLELKCLTAVPRWLLGVVQSVGLVRARYSKYCKGIDRLLTGATSLDALTPTRGFHV